MKIIVPVDETDRYQEVLDYVSTLQFPSPELRFVHAVQPIPSYDSAVIAIGALNSSDFTDLEFQAAEAHLDAACNDAKVMGLPATKEVRCGSPTMVITDAATEFGADLIAVAAAPKGPVEKFLAGSVTLALTANARHSLLIVRGPCELPEKLSVVYATDHSAYNKRCLEMLLNWNLGGISVVSVLNAFELRGREYALAGRVQEISESEVKDYMRRRVEVLAEEVAGQFRSSGVPAHGEALELPVREAIRRAIDTSGADLLVLGAAGHSLWERLTIGSTTLQEVASDQISLLILRDAGESSEESGLASSEIQAHRESLKMEEKDPLASANHQGLLPATAL